MKIRIASRTKGEPSERTALRFKFVLISLTAQRNFTAAQKGAAEENAADYWHQKGYEMFLSGYIDEAAQSYDESLKTDPENATFWLDNAPIHEILDNASGSQEAFELYPQDPEALQRKCEALQAQRKWIEADMAFKMAEKLESDGRFQSSFREVDT